MAEGILAQRISARGFSPSAQNAHSLYHPSIQTQVSLNMRMEEKAREMIHECQLGTESRRREKMSLTENCKNLLLNEKIMKKKP